MYGYGRSSVFLPSCFSRIGEHLEEYIPNLESLVLTGNHIEELTDVDCLSTMEKLHTLSLMQNPITAKQHYRPYVIYKLPQLRLLDFRKIKMKERDEAKALFKSRKGKELQKELLKRAKTFTPGGGLSELKKGPSEMDLKRIREAICNATSLEEVERLHLQIQTGQLPGKDNGVAHNGESSGTQRDYVYLKKYIRIFFYFSVQPESNGCGRAAVKCVFFSVILFVF